MMDRNFLDKVMEFGQHLESANRQYAELKESVAQMMEENHALQIENHHLRNRLEEIEKQLEDKGRKPGKKHQPKSAEIGEGHDNLARLYNEGFHVCNVHFGSSRKGEDCLFCLSFLNKQNG
ncbi:DNA replication initiation control protein YabA [Bhargavaea cecembensis]|nr:DNA replication initiation control protein YabA [Bhargavaea cecembensis]